MAQGSAVITNLQSALGCLGKCNCCDSLQSQINALTARVSAIDSELNNLDNKYLNKGEKPQIIQQSVASAEQLIVPGVLLLIGNAVNGLKPEIAAATATAGKALGAAGEAAGAAAGAVAKIAGIATQITAILASIATLLVLGSRIDAVESGLMALGNDVSRTLGLLFSVKNTADTALSTSSTADKKADNAQSTATEGLSLARVLSGSLASLKSKVEEISSALDKLSAFFVEAARQFLQGIANLSEMIRDIQAQVSEVKPEIASAKAIATSASTKADTALGTATNASTKADTALGTATSASTKADTALGTATNASTKADTALGTATSASTKADTAIRDVEGIKPRIAGVEGDIGGIKGRLGSIEIEIEKLKSKIGNVVNNFFTNVNNIVNNVVNNIVNNNTFINAGGNVDLSRIEAKIDSMPAGIIAAYIASPLVYQKTAAAAAEGTCQTMQPGGCGDAAMQRNNNMQLGNIGSIFNTGSNAVQTALLTKIDAKLGLEIAGGISGKLVDGFKWLQIDRVLNVLTTAATIHNAAMLSNDIGMTLVGAINNILQLVGLKDDKGQAFDIGSVISGTIQSLITSAIGAENYTQLTTTWAKANRIYQSSVNVLNSFQGLSSAILTGLEMTAGKVGKIGNALRDAGQVLDNAYSWMNPQPKFNRVTQALENLQQGASTIQMVTQVPLDIIQATTDLTTQTTELVNAIKDDTKPENKGKESPEPDKLKADNDAGKLASVGSDLTDLDLEVDD